MKFYDYIFSAVVALFMTTYSLSAQVYFGVSGVDESDSLTVREGTQDLDDLNDALVVGEIPHSAKQIEATGQLYVLPSGMVWREIRYGDLAGWVDNSLLSRNTEVDWGSELLECSGTEPFWSLRVLGDMAEFSLFDEGATDLERVAVQGAQNRRDIRRLQWVSLNDGAIVDGILLARETCSDGMSDFLFDIEIILSGISPTGMPLAGCCTVPAH